MKVLLFVVIASCLAFILAWHPKQIKAFADCLVQENISEEEAKRALYNAPIENPSTNIKCFIACYYEKQLLPFEGKSNDHVLASQILMNWCSDIKDKDNCEYWHKIHECFRTRSTS
ncbi:hypothetical protein DOY81_011016 [Sarcophaga bullata]|nr:hypothetical protein DOY81_011016 [Sarcophaga bullata]